VDTNNATARNPPPVPIISDRLWRNAFGANPAVIGSTIDLDGSPVHVVGIMPPRFTGFTIVSDVWLPVRMMARIDPSPRWTERLAMQSGTVIGRMTAGMTTATLNRYLAAALPIINDIATARV